MAVEDAWRAALDALDQALAERPHREGQTFSAVTRHLCTLRDGLIAQRGGREASAGERRQLGHLNAVISIVLAGHFPLGKVPWQELESARGWLAALLDGVAAP